MSSVTGTRGRVLTAIRAASEPITIDELAAELDIHPNTVRFHTGALEDEGYITQGRRPTGGKGRPRTVYSATDRGVRSGKRNYELLSKVLLEHLAASSDEPADAARSAGRAWGSAVAAQRKDGRRSAARVLVDFLDEMNFEPQPEGRRKPTQVLLHNCPFREMVDSHQDLVCNLHAGLLDGLVSDRGEAPELIPFHSRASCLVRLSPRDGSA